VALRPSNAKRLYADEKSTEIGEANQPRNSQAKGRVSDRGFTSNQRK